MSRHTGQNRQQFSLFATPLDEMIGQELKIYIYGYLNRVRSSRRLASKCSRNIELMCLTGCQQPSYHTTSDFRSFQPDRKALKATFRLFNQALDRAGLLSILGVNGLLQRIKTAFLNFLALRHRVKCQNWNSGLENFGVVWRGRVDQVRAWSIRA